MYKWNIDIVLKGSGVIMPCSYDGPEESATDVLMKLFRGKHEDEWLCLDCNNHESSAFISIGEIASIDIYERKEK